MKSAEQIERDKVIRMVAIYNMIPNLLWTAVFLIPISFYCYKYVTHQFIYLFLGISLATILLPNLFFDQIQLSKNVAFYKKIGVRDFNRFTQNGSFLKKFLQKKFPGYKVLSGSKNAIKRLHAQTYMFEKFHFFLFLFFIPITVHAMADSRTNWAIILIVSNLCYNVYPNLLQQYIRIKLKVHTM